MKKKLFGCVIFILMIGCEQKNELSDKTQANASVDVKIEKVKVFNEKVKLTYSGTVEAFQTIPLAFQGMGTVEKVLVEEGDEVQKGQLLATLDASDMKNSYKAVEAMHAQANDAYERMKEVYEKGSLPEIKWVEIKSNLEQAKVQLNLAKSRLEKCNLFAPDNGTIGIRNIEPGQLSTAGMPPFILMKIEKVLINFSVPENEIKKIKKGKIATVRISALGNKSFDGVISHVGVVANPYARTYMTKVTVQNADKAIKPGMVCDVTFEDDMNEKLMVVPYTAVTTDDQGNAFVYTVSPESSRVKKQNIKVGSYNKNGLIVLDGLVVNQLVIVEGKEKVTANTQIIL
ncbi:MAG TPA: efflux RND transporter periplasmic adaptor subunit [Bacteroidales bacterium]|nr:efflux RND transporter periplasmic adaptor subunit [Bacteroidales bacterium]